MKREAPQVRFLPATFVGGRTGEARTSSRSAPPSRRLDSVAQWRAPGSYPGKCGFDSCRGHSVAPGHRGTSRFPRPLPMSASRTSATRWKDCHRRGIPSRKRVGLAALGVRIPLLPPLEVWPSQERQRVASAQAALRAARRFESCCLRLSFRRGRVGKTRDCYSRGAGSMPAAGAARPRGLTRR